MLSQAPEQDAPPPSQARVLPERHLQFPLLDSLRGFAAISILVVHVAIFSGAADDPVTGTLLVHLDIGVPFFFLLSAFLLYRPFVVARVEGRPRPSLGRYFRRRFLRIAPAYWLALTVAAIVPGFVGAFTGNWWVYYGLLQNYPIFEPSGGCAVDPYRCGIPVAWSLSVEVAFYAVLPLFALAMGWLHRRRPRIVGLPIELAVVGLIAAISILIQSFHPDTDLRLWLFYSPLGRGWWFGLGLALAAISVAAERPGGDLRRLAGWIGRNPWPPWILAGLLYVAGAKLFRFSPLAFPLVSQREFVSQYLLVGAIAALVLLPAIFGTGGGGLPRRILAHPVPTWLGLVSYGIFLWQFPVMIFLIDEVGILGGWPGMEFPVLLVTTLAGTIACAAVSFYLLERPVMQRRRARPDPAVRAERRPA